MAKGARECRRKGEDWLRPLRSFVLRGGLIGVLVLAPIAGAQAQLSRLFGWTMPPGEVYHIIAAQGLHVTAPVYRNGHVYVADVVDPRGVHQRLIIDAYNGDILQAYRTGPGREAPETRERSVRAEPLDHSGDVPAAKSRKKPASRAAAGRENVAPASPLPAAPVPGPSPAPAPAVETGKSQPTPAEPIASTTAHAPVTTPELKSPAVNATPVVPLDDAAAAKKPSRPATDVPVAPLD